jgi:hypothetical protein
MSIHYENLVSFILLSLYFHLCKHGYRHDCVDVDTLVVGTIDVDKDPVALYLGYYN